MEAIGFGARFAVARRAGVAAAGPVFDFTGSALPAGASFARGSPATRFGAGGTLVSVAADVARIEPGGRGVLIEPAATNTLPASADWTDPAWTLRYLARNAAVLIEDATSGVGHSVKQNGSAPSYAAGQSVTMSVVAGEYAGPAKRYLVLVAGGSPVFADPVSAIFDLATGAATANGSTTAGTSALGGGMWLCWVGATAVAAGTISLVQVKLTDSATIDRAYAGDAASGIVATHVQIEAGGVASSRIPTGASAATRAADMLTLAWGTRGVADGTIGVRYTFDDGSTQDVATVVSGGTARVPTTLARRWLKRAERV